MHGLWYFAELTFLLFLYNAYHRQSYRHSFRPSTTQSETSSCWTWWWILFSWLQLSAREGKGVAIRRCLWSSYARDSRPFPMVTESAIQSQKCLDINIHTLVFLHSRSFIVHTYKFQFAIIFSFRFLFFFFFFSWSTKPPHSPRRVSTRIILLDSPV